MWQPHQPHHINMYCTFVPYFVLESHILFGNSKEIPIESCRNCPPNRKMSSPRRSTEVLARKSRVHPIPWHVCLHLKLKRRCNAVEDSLWTSLKPSITPCWHQSCQWNGRCASGGVLVFSTLKRISLESIHQVQHYLPPGCG